MNKPLGAAMPALTDNVELNQIMQCGRGVDNEKFWLIPLDSPTEADQLTGQGVFGDLSRPAVIGSELLQGESSVETVKWEEGKSLASGDWHLLFIRRGKQLRAIPHDGYLKRW